VAVVALVVAAVAVFLLTGALRPAHPIPTPSPSVQSQVIQTLTGLDVPRTEAVGSGGLAAGGALVHESARMPTPVQAP